MLLPGGTFWMGAQKEDPEGPNHDPEALEDESPVRRVALAVVPRAVGGAEGVGAPR